MVLEARERPPYPGFELALEQDVADQGPLAGARLEREEADAGQVLAVGGAVAATEELVAAAHREEGRALLEHGRAKRVGLRGEIRGDEQLLPVLAAADV